MSRWIVLALALSLVSCRTIVITEAGKYGEEGFSGLRNTVNTSLADVRRSDSTITVDDKGEDQGIQIVLDKFEASERFMQMVEVVGPELAASIAKAMIGMAAAEAVCAIPSVFSGAPDGLEIPEAPPGVEIPGGGE